MMKLSSSHFVKQHGKPLKTTVLFLSGLLLIFMIPVSVVKIKYPGFELSTFEPAIRFDCYNDYCGIRFDPEIVPTFGERNTDVKILEWINSYFGWVRLFKVGNFELQAFLSTDGLTCGGILLFGPGIELRIDRQNNLAQYIHDNDYIRLSIVPWCQP